MPPHSQHTRRIYEACLKVLRDAFKAPNLQFLEDASGVIQFVEAMDRSENTKKMYYIALKSTCRDLPDKTPALKAAELAYQAKMDAYNAAVRERMERQEMDDREKALWIDWPDVLKARTRAFETACDLYTYQDAIILSLYTFLPPSRVDYAPMRVVQSENEAPTGNLLLVRPSSMEFVMREYKTASKYGTNRIRVPKDLDIILRDWLELNPSGWLLCAQDGLPMTEKQLGSKVRAIFTRLVGKPVGVNILRHSFVSFLRKDEPTLQSQKHVAEAMGHSIGMSLLYRRIQ